MKSIRRHRSLIQTIMMAECKRERGFNDVFGYSILSKVPGEL